jgi:uncharacterized protein (DUF433 family)
MSPIQVGPETAWDTAAGKPIVTAVRPERAGDPVMPFIGPQKATRRRLYTDGAEVLYDYARHARVSEVTVDPHHEFGRPRFARGGTAVDNVIDLFRAGGPVDAVAEEFGLSRNEVEDAIRIATRAAA